MKHILSLALLCGVVTTAFGQELSFDGGALTFDSSKFATVNGVSTLSLSTQGSHYTADLAGTLDISSGVASTLGLNGDGWVFQESSGEIVITAQGLSGEAADPFAAYGFFAINNTGSAQNFSTSMTSTFSPTSFPNGATVSQSLGMSLTSMTGSAVGGQATQSGTLSLSSASPFQTGSSIASSTLGTSTSTAAFFDPANQIIMPPGTYNTLVVSTVGSYTPGAIVSLSGRVEVDEIVAAPEPPSWILLSLSGLAALIFHFRRHRLNR